MSSKADIIQKLRLLYDVKAVTNYPNECSELLHELSKFHICSTDKWSYVCQCALLNGALLGTDSDAKKARIISDLEIVGDNFLTARHAVGHFNLVTFSNTLKHHIEQKRNEMAKRLKEVKTVPAPILDDKDMLTVEKDVVQNVRSVMEDTSKEYKNIMERISNKCIGALGEPPCQFSHFAMGSLARHEITLYSDFENAIILGDGVDWNDATAREEAIEYFRWYATLFDMILINFGETPISLVGVDGLNDHYSRDKSKNWFYDTFIFCGIMFDSCLPYASKNPFGRKPTFNKPASTELILPSDEMLQYLTETNSLREGYHLSNMLLESKHVGGNERLFEDFRLKSIGMANDLRRSPGYIEQDLKYTRENLSKFNLTPTFNTSGWFQHAKKTFYRPMSIHIPFIARLCGYSGFPSTCLIVEKLNKEAGLSDRVSHNLLYGIVIANLIRTKVYSERTKQSDRLSGSVHMIDSDAAIRNVFDAVGDRSALDCYEITLALQNAIFEIVGILESNIQHHDFSYFAKETVIKCLERHVEERGNLKLHGDIHLQFQNYDRACDIYKLALSKVSKINQPLLSHEAQNKCDILMSLGLCNVRARNFFESLKWYKELVQSEKKLDRGIASLANIAAALTMSGQCYTEEPTIREGYKSCIEEAENILQKLRSLEPDNREHLKGLAELRDTEGFYFLRTLDFNASILKYHEAQELFEEYFATGVANDDTVKVKNGIAISLLKLERSELNNTERLVFTGRNVKRRQTHKTRE